jgi:release factor H-coupled RctB family protein
MPDLHKGDRFPIGCAIVASGIYPALIGSDIGCGISLYPLGKQPSHLTPEKLASRLKGLDEPWEGNVKEWLALYGITQETEFDAESLGTVGGGNHFAEVVTVEQMVDVEACESMGVVTGNLYLLVHTGSRGLGSSILRHYTKSDPNPYFPPGHSEFEIYLAKHDNAVLWAKANRDLVAHRIRSCIFGRRNEEEQDENGEMDGETAEKENSEPSSAPTPDPRAALEKILDVTHNSVTPCGFEVEGEMKDIWLHRKGAAPSDKGFVPCPGSRGDFSWILQPAGQGKTNG